MIIRKQHSKSFWHVLVMCFVLFALSPCLFKGSVLSFQNTALSKPLNVTKTTTATYSCQFVTASVTNQAPKQAVLKSKYLRLSSNQTKSTFVVKQVFSKKTFLRYLQTSVPKYILFKRLKLHLLS